MRSHLYCLAAVCLFSTLEVSSKLMAGDMSPNAIAAWRFLIGGLVLLPSALKWIRLHKLKLTIGSILSISALGVLNVCISMLLLQWSIYWGKASISAIIISLNPLFVSIFAWLFLKERLSLLTWVALCVGFLGLVLIVVGEPAAELHTREMKLGIMLAVLAALSFGLYTVLAKKSVLIYGNMVTNSFSFIFGALALALISRFMGRSVFFTPSLPKLSLVLYLGLGVTGLAYYLYFEGMKSLYAARASVYFLLKPMIAEILAFISLGEVLSNWQIAGMILIMLALGRNLFSRQSSLQKA